MLNVVPATQIKQHLDYRAQRKGGLKQEREHHSSKPELKQGLTKLRTMFAHDEENPDRAWQATLLCVVAAWLAAALLVVLR